MNRDTFKKIATYFAIVLISILLLQFIWQSSHSGIKDFNNQDEKVNLALRRTAHQLLKESGDSTSRISPVQQITTNVWLVRFDNSFNYARLPAILQESFDVHHIHSAYDVAVFRCGDSAIQVGYNFIDFTKNKEVPCQRRDLPPDCYNLQLTLSAEMEKRQDLPLTLWLFGGVLAIAIYSLAQKWHRSTEKIQETQETDDNLLLFGKSRFEVTRQRLLCGDKNHQLTYREAKLLHLFILHPNQILERGFIIDNVWANEGVLVGRSVDMFVSRIRKMLKDDPSIQLVAIHGIGYRMEIS